MSTHTIPGTSTEYHLIAFDADGPGENGRRRRAQPADREVPRTFWRFATMRCHCRSACERPPVSHSPG